MNTMKRLVLAFGLIGMGCGGGESVSLVGKSSTEAAQTAAEAVCDHCDAEIKLDCVAGDMSGELDCTGTLEPVDRAECLMEGQEDFSRMWECANDQQKGRLEDCLNDMLDEDCPDQGDADAAAEAASMGSGAEGQIPPSCTVFLELLSGCDTPPS